MPHIALNAHLLSAQAGYRSAGIHGYIYHTLLHLPTIEPNWRYSVLVGEGNPPSHPQMEICRSRFSTAHPLKRILWEQIMQPGVLRRLQPNLYHAMAFVSPYGLKMPAVVTVYDLSFMRYPSALSLVRRLYLQLFTRRSCEHAARILAISESTANDLVTLLNIPRQKITVAVPGVDEDFKPLDPQTIQTFRQQYGLPERFMLHLGTLEPRKNLALLLRAYAALPENLRREVHLVLAGGKGWDYDDVFSTIETYGLASTVHLPGYIAREALPLWYNAAEIFVYPSLYEGWGLPVTEAMACGCPTLVSETSSLPEAAGETGKRLPPNDESAWTETLHQVLIDKHWQQESRIAGIARAQHFTWQQTARATVNTYRKVIAS